MTSPQKQSRAAAYLFRYGYVAPFVAVIALLVGLVAYFSVPDTTITSSQQPSTPPVSLPPPAPVQITATQHDLAEAAHHPLQATDQTATQTATNVSNAQLDPQDAEKQYTVEVQNQLTHTQQFKVITDPDSSTQQSRVSIGFDLNRDGILQSKTVTQSSSNAQIDRDALNALNRTSFAPFPQNAWSNETTHHFAMTLALITPSSDTQ